MIQFLIKNNVLDQLRRLIIGSYYLSLLYYLYSRCVHCVSLRHIEGRKNKHLFEFEELAKNINYYPTSLIKDNCFYGTAKALQDSPQKLDLKNRCLIEHGLILGEFVQKHVEYSFADTIVTFSEYRKTIIEKKVKKKVVVIGPYIKHVAPLLSQEQLAEMKKELGKCLVVFPSHSIESTEAGFDIDTTIIEIERVKRLLDVSTVIICMYWKDIQLQKFHSYLLKGYKITTAGHSFDYYFLNRLKSIISLADFTMSNNVGTHVGYCISLNKPHYIFRQEVKQIKLNSDFERELTQRNKKDYITYNNAREEIAEMFSDLSPSINQDMRLLVERYWGAEIS